MRFIKLENNIPINYTIDQLFVDTPEAVIYKNSQMPNEELLANYNVYPLMTTPQPDLNEDEIAEEGIPEFKDGIWQQSWVIRPLTESEILEVIDGIQRAELILDPIYLPNTTVQATRYNICKNCTSFTILKTCKECGCIMPLKTRLANAVCPLGKW